MSLRLRSQYVFRRYGTRHHSVARALYGDEDATIAFRSGGLYMGYNAVAALALIDNITHDASQDAADGTHACSETCRPQAAELAAMGETMRGLRADRRQERHMARQDAIDRHDARRDDIGRRDMRTRVHEPSHDVCILWSRLPSLAVLSGRGIMSLVLWECQSLWWAAGAAAGRFPARAVFPCRF